LASLTVDGLHGVDRFQQVLSLFDQLLGLGRFDRLVVEGSAFEQLCHLPCKRVALAGDRTQLRFELVVGAITGCVTLQRLCLHLQGCQTKFANGRVDLLVYLGQLGKDIAVLAQ